MRNGADAQLSSAGATYGEMLRQIARDYSGLPDARTLTIPEIVFFYEGLRPELKKHTRGSSLPSGKPQPRPSSKSPSSPPKKTIANAR